MVMLLLLSFGGAAYAAPCVNKVELYSCGFEGDEADDWVFIDKDVDGFNFFVAYTPGQLVRSGTGCITSQSYDNIINPGDPQSLTPDNWALTPAIALPSAEDADDIEFSWYAAGQDNTFFHEYYSVYVFTGSDAPTSDNVEANCGTELFSETVNTTAFNGFDGYQLRSLDLSAYAGQTIRIAFRHHNITDQYMLNIDDVSLSAMIHVWDEGVVTTPATESDKGIMTYTCAECGATKTAEIPMLNPKTGDSTSLILPVALASAALLVIVFALYGYRSRKYGA